VATSKIPVIPFPAQTSNLPPTITADQIARYAEISSLVSGLEAQRKQLRVDLLGLYAAGAYQEETAPYVLNFVEQERCTVDWKAQAIALATKVFGVEGIAKWQAETERAAVATTIVSIRVKPNPAFAASVIPKKAVASERRLQ
jgi:hypothetical protein